VNGSNASRKMIRVYDFSLRALVQRSLSTTTDATSPAL
jgi:hypothetical protein